MHPAAAGFFKDYLANQKVVQFGERCVVNTNLPPFPSGAFDGLVDQFTQLGDVEDRKLYSITLAVTNRCGLNCWHCYNAGRSQIDLPLEALGKLAGDLQSKGAVMITLTGGEPLLRDDLEQIAASFDDRSCVIVGTTGMGLTPRRAAFTRKTRRQRHPNCSPNWSRKIPRSSPGRRRSISHATSSRSAASLPRPDSPISTRGKARRGSRTTAPKACWSTC